MMIFQNAVGGTISQTVEDLNAQQFVLEASLQAGTTLAWEVSNVTPYVRLNGQGEPLSLQGFSPADSDFVRVKAPFLSGLYYLNGSFRYMRFRVLSGTATYVALRAYAPNEAFPGSFLDASDIEAALLTYQLPDAASVSAYTGQSKVLWVYTGAARGMYLRDDASASAATIVGNAGQKWFKVTV